MARDMNIGDVVLGRYVILEILAYGGQATVAKARCRDSGRAVVIKQLQSASSEGAQSEDIARIQREGRLQFSHANIVDPLECTEEDGEYYLILPYIDGDDLEMSVRRNGGKLTAGQAVQLIRQITELLFVIHQRGVVHRDIKPHNILIDRGGQPHLIDFGISSNSREQTITRPGVAVGTPAYMSPEQVRDATSVDARSDLFSLGGVFYFLLTGRSWVNGADPEACKFIICNDPPRPPRQIDPSIPRSVEMVCLRLLEKEPRKRPESAKELLQILGAIGSNQPSAGFCHSCGLPRVGPASFCSSCGAAVDTRASETFCLACGSTVNGETNCPYCHRPFSNANHRLTFITGSAAGRRFRIAEGDYPVGRDILSPRDFAISRVHFDMHCSNGTVRVHDAGSTNKTHVGGRPADQTLLLLPNCELSLAGNVAIYTTHSKETKK